MEYKKVHMFGSEWSWERIETTEAKVENLCKDAETLTIGLTMKEVLWEIKQAYIKANNPPSGEETVLEWKL